MSRDKQNIKATDWLTRGIPKEQLEREKREAIKEAEAELHNKQIEEMAKELCVSCEMNDGHCYFLSNSKMCPPVLKDAEHLYNAGYRKASDVAEEIFAEIEKEIELALDSNYKVKRDAQDDNDSLVMYVEGKITCLRGLFDFIAELKKKYIGKDTNGTTKESEKKNG